MADVEMQSSQDATARNGDSVLETKLRQLFTRQRLFREQLEATRAELDRVNDEVLRTQEEYCTTPGRDDEYCQCLERILGYDPRDLLKGIEEGKMNPCSLEDLLAELERANTP